jgi:hypothetical protein
MSDIITINLNSLDSRKRVKIGDTIFIVRRLGAGEELDINQLIRELDEISARAKKSKDGNLSEKDKKRFLDLQETSLRIYAKTFDDGGDGSKSLELIRQLSFPDRTLVHDKIFGIQSIVDEVDSEEQIS